MRGRGGYGRGRADGRGRHRRRARGGFHSFKGGKHKAMKRHSKFSSRGGVRL